MKSGSVNEILGKFQESLARYGKEVSFDYNEVLCPHCRTPLTETVSVDSDGNVLNRIVDDCHVCRMRQAREEIRKKNAQKLMADSKVPALYRGANLHDNALHPQVRPYGKMVQRFLTNVMTGEQVDNRPFVLLLQGGYGTGKTHLATAAINYLMGNSHSAVYVDAVSAALRVRTAWERGENPDKAFKEFLLPDLLVIDEIGTQESLRQNLVSAWSRIIQTRYEECRPMILCTNLSYNEMLDSMEHRIVDRITDVNRSVVVQMMGGSLRKTQMNADFSPSRLNS